MGRFLFLSDGGDGLGLAFRLKSAGHEVGAFIRQPRSKHNMDNMLLKFSTPAQWRSWLTKRTTIVFDSTGGGTLGERLRWEGYPVFMGTKFADLLEEDRDAGFEYMKQVGIRYPQVETFFDWTSGKRWVKGHSSDRWVFKPSRAMSHDDHIGTYLAYDAEDMIEMMDYMSALYHGPVEYVLQLYVEGVCISTEGWFNGEDWMTPFNHTVEKKPLMNDNLGPSCGCAGNAVWAWHYGYNHIIEEGIKRFGPVLREFGYVGPIDLNTAINEEGVWALEWTPRFGYDAMPALLKLYQGDIGDLLAALARGERVREMSLRRGFGAAVRISVPPYPSEEFHHTGGVPVRGWTRADRDNLYFYEVQLDAQNHFVTTPASGTIATLLGYGNTIEEAFEEPNRLARNAHIPNKQYRTDMARTLDLDFGRFERLINLQRRGEPAVRQVEVVS